MSKQLLTRAKLNGVIVTFPVFFTPKKFKADDKDEFYSASFLIKPTHPDLPRFKAAIQAAGEAKWKARATEQLRVAQARDKLPIHDGDLKGAKPYGAAYAGMLYISARNNARTSQAPGIFDNVIDPETGLARVIKTANDYRAPYSGMIVNVILDTFGYEKDGGIGIGASIAGVQYAGDGERLAGGSIAVADDFDAIPEKGQVEAVVSGKGAASLF